MEIKIPYEYELDLPFVRAWVSSVKAIVKMIQKKLGDGGIPLETRWEMYLQIQSYLKTESSYLDFDSVKQEISWYDDFYLERGETQELDGDFVKNVLKKFPSTSEEELKQEILDYAYAQGIGAFENDW